MPGGDEEQAIALARAVLERMQSQTAWALRPATIDPPDRLGRTMGTVDGDSTSVRMTSLIGRVVPGARVMVLVTPPSGHHIVGWVGAPSTSVPLVQPFTDVTQPVEWLPPAGLRYIEVEGVGGGGGGGGVTGSSTSGANGCAGGGGGGGYCKSIIPGYLLTGPVVVTVGRGGNGGTNGATPGQVGGNTSFGSFWVANGGGFGAGNTAGTGDQVGARGLGGTAAGGNVLNVMGGHGDYNRTLDGRQTFRGSGGDSVLGRGGNSSGSVGGAGPAGYLYGGGGAGAIAAATTRAGGRGADGVVIIHCHF
ncbi:glycine-rich domain-containing protein [Micromonospora sp. WMMC273]|uniref:glycine-rich domain-containing protein n=1 Tax=Micromonospora sp. WMMC273 TaxID=3015157 RepID=UPI003FA52519